MSSDLAHRTPLGRSWDESTSLLRVLWIDAAVAESLRVIGRLTCQGVSVDAVRTGAAALRQACRCRYDAILIEMRLPDMHGLRVMQEIRQQFDTPIVAVSSAWQLESPVAARRLGAVTCAAKPLDDQELLAVLRTVDRPLPANRESVCQPDVLPLMAPLTDPTLTLAAFLHTARVLREALMPTSVSPSGEARALPLPPVMHPKVAEILDLLEQSPGWWSEEDLARAIGTSRPHLGRLVRSQLGMDFRALRRAVTVRRAALHVLTTSEQFAQIAYALGFNHGSQLDREFRRQLGATPGSLRRLWIASRR